MEEHHKANLSKIKPIKFESLDKSFVDYLNSNFCELKGIKSFSLFALRKGLIFKKSVLTLSIFIDSAKSKQRLLPEIGKVIQDYYSQNKSKAEYIDFMLLCADDECENQTYKVISDSNADIWNL